MPHALVVDDSRTARAVLKHMLSKEQYSVHALESAEAGLQYIADNSVDLVFMDHMMPGMDGFEAVKKLKADEHTAHIPIVMYTSKQGEVYRGQAQALGATEILGKPTTQEQLHAVLIAVAEQPREASKRVLSNDTAADDVVETAPNIARFEARDPANASLNSEIGGDEAPDNSATATTSTEEKPPLVVEPKSAASNAAPAASPTVAASVAERSSPWWRRAAIALGLLCLYMLWSSNDRAGGESAQQDMQRELFQRLLDSSSAASMYPNNELPLSGARVGIVENLLEAAVAAELQGTLIVRSHVGQFCMSQSGDGELFVTPDHESVESCTVIGQDEKAAMRKSERRSKAFRELMDMKQVLGTVKIKIIPMGASEALTQYPEIDRLKRAGDWNAVARANNRLEFSFEAE